MPRGFRPDIKVQGGVELAKVSAELKAAGNKTLQKTMRKRLRTSVEPVAAEIKRDAAQQSKMVAAAITTRFSYTGKRAGATIAAQRSKMPPGKEGLPGLLEFGNRGRRGILRHPVFAEKSEPRRKWTWAEQPVRPYFYKNARRYDEQVTKAMVAVLDDVEKELRGKP
jgi:hypothetical protein